MLTITKNDKGLFLDDGTEGVFVPDVNLGELKRAISVQHNYGLTTEITYLTLTYVKHGYTLCDDVEGVFISMQDRDNILRELNK
jgi:hypothetical protein